MLERRRGHIVGISSLAQYRGLPRNAIYSASKAFLSTFLEGLRIDLRGTGVEVTDVRPGFVRTSMTAGNKHVMPFLMDLPDATEAILQGMTRREPVVAFPWQLAAIVLIACVITPVFNVLTSEASLGSAIQGLVDAVLITLLVGGYLMFVRDGRLRPWFRRLGFRPGLALSSAVVLALFLVGRAAGQVVTTLRPVRSGWGVPGTSSCSAASWTT
jgi:hypothetical protein